MEPIALDALSCSANVSCPFDPNRFREQRIFNSIPIEVCVDLSIYEIVSKLVNWLGICL